MNHKAGIGIIGLGVLGWTLQKWFRKKKVNIFGYDKFKNIGSLEEVDRAEIIFLCLPTPYNSKTGYDLSALEENIKYFNKPKIFVVKSTVLPGTTEYFQKKYKNHYFIHNPEFLSELTAEKDFRNPFFQIIGYTPKSKNIANRILNILPRGKILNIIVESNLSEMFKIIRNAFFSTKIIFSNKVYDLCQKLNIDYENLKFLMKKDPWIGGIHFEIFHKGKRGFGGKCLPKDFMALIYFYKKLELKLKLFQAVWEENIDLLKKQKLINKLRKDWLNNKN